MDNKTERDGLLPLELPTTEEVERKLHSHEYSLALIEQRRPDVIEGVARAYAGGASMRSIARAFGVSMNTISQILDKRTDAVDAHKDDVLKHLRRGIRVAAETLAEDIENGDLRGKDLAIAMGIMVDQMGKLSGTNAEINRTKAETVNDLETVLRALPSGSSVQINVGQPVVKGEKSRPKGGGGGAAASETVIDITPKNGAASDNRAIANAGAT